MPRRSAEKTRPVDENERQAGLAAGHGDIRDDVFFGTLEEIDRNFKEMGWSDGLPFIPPTFELPRNWDALMEELGYRPLSEYCISRRKK